MEEDDNFQQIEFNNNINFTPKIPNQNNFPVNGNLSQNNYGNNLLHGLNSNLDTLLSNLKQNTSTDRIKYNASNSKMKSPIKVQSNNISNLGLVEAYNYLVESNSKRNNNYFSPGRPITQNNYQKNNTLPKSNNSIYSNQNPRVKTSDNSFLTKTDYMSGINGVNGINGMNEINNSVLSQPRRNIRNNTFIGKGHIVNNNRRKGNKSQKLKNSSTNQSRTNSRHLSYNTYNNYNNFDDMNMEAPQNQNQNYQIAQLYNVLKKLNDLNRFNIDNKNEVLNMQQQFMKMQNIILNAINKFGNTKFNNRNKGMNYSLQLKQANNMKNKLLSDINILNNEKSSILNELSRLKKNEEENINAISLKEEENIKLKNELKNLNILKNEYEKNKEDKIYYEKEKNDLITNITNLKNENNN